MNHPDKIFRFGIPNTGRNKNLRPAAVQKAPEKEEYKKSGRKDGFTERTGNQEGQNRK